MGDPWVQHRFQAASANKRLTEGVAAASSKGTSQNVPKKEKTVRKISCHLAPQTSLTSMNGIVIPEPTFLYGFNFTLQRNGVSHYSQDISGQKREVIRLQPPSTHCLSGFTTCAKQSLQFILAAPEASWWPSPNFLPHRSSRHLRPRLRFSHLKQHWKDSKGSNETENWIS